MTESQKITTGARIVKTWETMQDKAIICRRLGLSLKEYYECLTLFLQKPVTTQADMVQHTHL